MSATATTTTTAIPLNPIPPAQQGGPPAPTPPANNALLPANIAAPAPNNNVNTVGNVPAIALAPGPSKRIWPKFSVSKWFMIALGVVGTVATLYFGLVTLRIGLVSLRLARWSASNDLYGSCVDARSINISSAICDDLLSKPPAPLPVLAKRTLGIAYIGHSGLALTIAVTVTAGVVLLIARHTVFRKYLETRPLPATSLARTNVFCDTLFQASTVRTVRMQRRQKVQVINFWNNSSVKDVPLLDEGSTDDESTVNGDVSSHLVLDDAASIYMAVRDIDDPNCDTEKPDLDSTTREDTMADDYKEDAFDYLMRTDFGLRDDESMDSSQAMHNFSLHEITAQPPVDLPRRHEVPDSESGSLRPLLPYLSVQELQEWHVKAKADKHAKLTEYPYLMRDLYGRDHVFIIDDSTSMQRHKKALEQLMQLLVYVTKTMNPGSMDLYFLSSDKIHKVKNSSGALRLLGKYFVGFGGQVDISLRLGNEIQEYCKNIDIHAQQHKKRPLAKRSIYILTVGAVYNAKDPYPIKRLISKLLTARMAREQFGIQFIRFGDDQQGIDTLDRLDRLSQTAQLGLDIIDTEPADGNVWKMLHGSINAKFDEDLIQRHPTSHCIYARDAGDGLWWKGKLLQAGNYLAPLPSNFVEVLDEDFHLIEVKGLPFPPIASEERLDGLGAGLLVGVTPHKYVFAPQATPSERIAAYFQSIADQAGINFDVTIPEVETPSLKALASSGKLLTLPAEIDRLQAPKAASQGPGRVR
ncbi:hypothetical protein LTS10_013057 [Elasticomyces elasticus]|nr:hypothetical protein LTS10_013057 [Elasticomyces elasticus]